ncbi:MAG: tetratricopeptide repeat protein, partial [bacterium]
MVRAANDALPFGPRGETTARGPVQRWWTQRRWAEDRRPWLDRSIDGDKPAGAGGGSPCCRQTPRWQLAWLSEEPGGTTEVSAPTLGGRSRSVAVEACGRRGAAGRPPVPTPCLRPADGVLSCGRRSTASLLTSEEVREHAKGRSEERRSAPAGDARTRRQKPAGRRGAKEAISPSRSSPTVRAANNALPRGPSGRARARGPARQRGAQRRWTEDRRPWLVRSIDGEGPARRTCGAVLPPDDGRRECARWYSRQPRTGRRYTRDTKKAAALFREVIAQEPSIPEAHLGLARCLHRLNAKTEARRASLEQALTLRPNYYEALVSMGLLSWKDADKALEMHRKAVQLKPQHAPGYYGLAHAYAVKGKGDEALTMLKHAMALEPNNPEYSSWYGYLLGIFRRAFDEAHKYTTAATRMAGANEKTHVAHAYVQLVSRHLRPMGQVAGLGQTNPGGVGPHGCQGDGPSSVGEYQVPPRGRS